MDPYLLESSWHSSSRRATSAAISPPSRPAQLHAPFPLMLGRQLEWHRKEKGEEDQSVFRQSPNQTKTGKSQEVTDVITEVISTSCSMANNSLPLHLHPKRTQSSLYIYIVSPSNKLQVPHILQVFFFFFWLVGFVLFLFFGRNQETSNMKTHDKKN